MPQISVIVPVYKVEPYLRRCVDSVLRQTFADFELILVDDGSPDNCGAICDEYAAKDSRVVVIHQENGGLSAARNAGIDWAFANSDSQWLTFIDSDDWVHAEYLERLLNAAVKDNVQVSVCGYAETAGEVPKIDEKSHVPRIWNVEDFYVQHNVNATIACCKLYQKECFNTIRYPEGKIHEDEFVTHMILFQVHRIAVIEACLYCYFVNDQGITKSKWRPQRLQALNAITQQIEYMKLNGFEKAYRHAIKKYIVAVSNQIYLLRENECKQHNKYKSKLRRTLKKKLCKYHKLLPLEQFPAVYENAFPCAMYVFWIVKAQISKIKKKFG